MVPVKNSDKTLCILYRPETTDEKVIPEVLGRGVYERRNEFHIMPNEKWLDLGANIGTFSLLCLTRGARVVAYEPEPENFQLLHKNIALNFPRTRAAKLVQKGVATEKGSASLFLCRGDYNKYRHTIIPRRGRSAIPIRIEDIRDVLKANAPVDGIKMDIEGAEIPILEVLQKQDYKEAGVQKLVFEYSFDFDRSIPRFLAIVHNLKNCFSFVYHRKIDENQAEYRYWPAAIMVYCWNPSDDKK